MTPTQRDAARTKGCSTSGTFRTLISGRVPGKVRLTPDMEESWIRLAIDAEIPDGGSVSGLYRSGVDPLSLGAQNADPNRVTPDQDYAEIEGTLTSNGRDPVRVPPGGAALTYAVRMPTLLLANRSSLPGGSTVYGLRQAYDRPDYRTDPVGGRPRPVPVTDRIGRLDGWQVTFSTHEAEAEFQAKMLDVEWIIEAPRFNVIHRVRLYEISEPDIMDTGLWDEERPKDQGERTVFQVARAEILESGQLR